MKQKINADLDKKERVVSRYVENTQRKGIKTKNLITDNTDNKSDSNPYANKLLQLSSPLEKKTRHRKIHSSCGRKVNFFLSSNLNTLSLEAAPQNLFLEIIFLNITVLIGKVDPVQRKMNLWLDY